MRRLLQNLALALAAVLLTLGLVELTLRAISPGRATTDVEYQPDGHLGVRLTPSRRYELAGGGTATINAAGFRGAREIEVPKPEGRLRIVTLGGSSTFCFRVSDEQTWSSRLEERLRAELPFETEVINAGVPGYSSFESKIHYVYRIRRLEPDLVVVYHTWNDLKRFRTLERQGYFLRGSWQEPALGKLLRRFELAWRARNLYRHRIQRMQREDAFPAGTPEAEPIPRDGAAHRWERSNWNDLGAWISADGVLPVFVTQAGLLSRENLSDPSIRRRVEVDLVGMSHPVLLTEWEAVSEMMRSAASEHGAVLVEGRAGVPADLEHFSDAVHLTDAGNAALAETVANRLLADPRVRPRRVESSP